MLVFLPFQVEVGILFGRHIFILFEYYCKESLSNTDIILVSSITPDSTSINDQAEILEQKQFCARRWRPDFTSQNQK